MVGYYDYGEFLRKHFDVKVQKIAIDFDSANTNIYKVGSGLVLSEPTVCAVSSGEKYRLKAIGEDAKKLIGKTSENTKIVFPVFEGEIVSVKVASGLLEGFLKKICMTTFLKTTKKLLSKTTMTL